MAQRTGAARVLIGPQARCGGADGHKPLSSLANQSS
jgi:hypothetical protein